jgi:hypothetical protein
LKNDEFLHNIKTKSLQNPNFQKNNNTCNNNTNFNSNFILPSSHSTFQNYESDYYNSNNVNNQKFYQESYLKNNYQNLSDMDYNNLMNYNQNFRVAQHNNHPKYYNFIDNEHKLLQGQNENKKSAKKNFK